MRKNSVKAWSLAAVLSALVLALALVLTGAPALADEGGATTEETPAAATDGSSDPTDENVAASAAPEATTPESTTGDTSADGSGSTNETTTTTTVSASVTYRVHGQTYGWQGWKVGDAMAGTTSQSKRLEAIEIKLTDSAGKDIKGTTGGIRYQVHGQTYGWTQGWKADGATAGTTGKSKRLEAIQIELTGDIKNSYDVYYRVHAQTFGWLGWAKNGEKAGSTGYAKRLEAIQIVLVKKDGGTAPGSSDTVGAFISTPTLSYAAWVQGTGWQTYVGAGATAGTTGKALRIEGFRATVNTNGTGVSGSIEYRVYSQSTGWSSTWSANGGDAGTVGSGKRVEAIQIRLTGTMADNFDVYYRVHSQSFGWLGWAKNGATAGTTSGAKRAEAIQVRLVVKGGSAPGSTANAYVNCDVAQNMLSRAQRYSSPTSWLILINRSDHQLGVYQRSGGKWTQRYLWACSVGKKSTPTPTGTFHVASRGYSFSEPGLTCYYWTQFNGSYLIHSIVYHINTWNVLDGRLGMSISHGCVRLATDNAKWVYQNIPTRTTVVVY